MTSTKERPIFPQLSSPYLRALGELMICDVRLRHLLETTDEGPRWRAATEDVLQRSATLTGILVTGPLAERALRVQTEDGSYVAADVMYLHRLIRHMNYQISAAQIGAAAGVRETTLAS